MNAITALLSRINISKAKELLLKTVLPTVLITGIVLFSISPVSCKLSEEGIQILTGDFTVPHLTLIDVPDGEHVVFGFSKPVKDVDAFVSLTNMDEENVMLSLYAKTICKSLELILLLQNILINWKI